MQVKKITIHPTKNAQIKALIFNKVFINVLAEYYNYSKDFLVKYITKLLEYISINNHIFKLNKSN